MMKETRLNIKKIEINDRIIREGIIIKIFLNLDEEIWLIPAKAFFILLVRTIWLTWLYCCHEKWLNFEIIPTISLFLRN